MPITLKLSRAEILERAKRHVGHREVSPNRSPLIDEWMRACGLDPAGGHPWCAAFVSWCLGLTPGIAGALKLGTSFTATTAPLPADLMYFATNASGSGHIGIVVERGLDEVLCIEGNSENSVRWTRRLRSEVLFATLPLPSDSAWPAVPLVRVAKAGTR